MGGQVGGGHCWSGGNGPAGWRENHCFIAYRLGMPRSIEGRDLCGVLEVGVHRSHMAAWPSMPD